MDIIIIGAGISGISLAYRLSEIKRDNPAIGAVTVIDKGHGAGGCIQTVCDNGFQVESGPNGVLYSKKHVRELYMRAGLENVLQISAPVTKRKYIQSGGQLHAVPSGPISALTSKLLSFPGKMRVLKEPFTPPKTDDSDESIAEFTTRRIGAEAADKLIAAVVGGIYAGDSSKISVKSAFPRMYALEHNYGSLIKGMLNKGNDGKRRERADRKHSGMLISSHTGMQGLVTALAEKCAGVNFRYNTSVEKAEKTDKGYKIYTNNGVLECDRLAVCCNAYDAAGFLNPLDETLAKMLAKVVYAPIFICGMGFSAGNISHPLDGFGYLAAPDEKSVILGTLFSSSVFSGRAPDGKVLITSITVGDRNRELFALGDTELKEMIFAQVKDILGVKTSPESVTVFRHERSIPQYYIGHSAVVEKADELTGRLRTFYMGGNSCRGISVADCIQTSLNIAEKITENV
ncbi:MAG: protoporphyrinogen oxidase [Deferribacteraceae bacterium]|jgi:oxygen-dependent protoporphyrinogen oxidase|nr:protoporphyrinogen oxidase [Deferribacteraceae bacterium]